MPFTGITATTVVIGLALYALTILVRSMLAGLAGVPDEVRESATGLGTAPGRLLLRIELPLALPVMMAGLRVATVSTVALTTVGTLVSYGGLGNLIQDGVQNDFKAELLAASVLCVVLAFALDALHRRPAVAGDALDEEAGRHERRIVARRGTTSPPASQLAAAPTASGRCWSSSCCSASPRSLIAAGDRRCRSRCGWATSAAAASWRSTSPTSAGRCRPSLCSPSWSPSTTRG